MSEDTCATGRAWRLTVIPVLLLLVGCAGGGSPATADPVTGAGGAAFESAYYPPMPAQSPAEPRVSNYTDVQRLRGDECYAKSASAQVVEDTHLLQLLADAGGTSWGAYEFTGIQFEDLPVLISVKMLPAAAGAYYLGVTDYVADSWRWYEVPAGTTDFSMGITHAMRTTNGSGAMAIALLCFDGEAAVIESVSMSKEILAPPPAGLTASDGDHARKIVLSWEDPAVTYPGLDYDSVIV